MPRLSGLPVAIDAEKMLLGSILIREEKLDLCAGTLAVDDFALESHRRIYGRMLEMRERGEPIDRLTIAQELDRYNELQSVGGLTYIISLDDNMPEILHLDSYIRAVLEKSTYRKTIAACQQVAQRCLMAEDDSQSILEYAESILSKLSEAPLRKGRWMTPGEIVSEYPGGINAFLQPVGGGMGIPTPWPPLTESLAGLHAGELILVAGRPSMGKSIAALQMAYWAAKAGYGTAVVSIEMSKESLIQRLTAWLARVDAQRLRTAKLTRDERFRAAARLSEVANLPIDINDARLRMMSTVAAAVRRLRTKREVNLLVIDHLQLMTSGAKGNERRHDELSEISHALKTLAGDMDLTVILVSQLNRQCEIENRRPQLSDLKETGSLEEDADVVLFVHRPERYAKNQGRPEFRGQAEFIVAKQRNGPTGLKRMLFFPEFQSFEVPASDSAGPSFDEDV